MNDAKVKSWNDLKVLNKAHELVLQIYKITKDYPMMKSIDLLTKYVEQLLPYLPILQRDTVEKLKRNSYSFLLFREVRWKKLNIFYC